MSILIGVSRFWYGKAPQSYFVIGIPEGATFKTEFRRKEFAKIVVIKNARTRSRKHGRRYVLAHKDGIFFPDTALLKNQ